MKKKQDIGHFIEQQLKAGNKEMSSDFWERIDTTLDRQRKRRRGFLFLIGIPLTVVLAFYVFDPQNRLPSSNEAPTEETITDSNLIELKPQITTKNEVSNEHAIIENDSITPSHDLPVSENLVDNAIDNPKKEPKTTTAKQNRVFPKEIDSIEAFTNDSTATKKTTLHYFNAATKEEFKTQNNSQIDSVLQQKRGVKNDSITPN